MFINCHTYYSLRYGTLSVEELVTQAKQLHIKNLVLTDINSSQGIMDFIKECNENDIQPIAGIEFRRDNLLLFIGIAKNNQGFSELNRFLTHHNLNKIPLPNVAPKFRNVFVVYPYVKGNPQQLENNEFIGIRPFDISQLITSEFKNDQSKLVVHYPITLKSLADYEVHQCLRAVDENVLISQLANKQMALPDERFIDTEALESLYHFYPQVIRNTKNLLQQCKVGFNFKEPKNKKRYTESRQNDIALLQKLATEGMIYRYGRENRVARERLAHELKVIDDLGFSSYFLIAWDIINFTLGKGIYHVGRGSGANSIVAYCLKITDVDPIELDLYFERFLNPKRTSPPDFDIDFSWKDRDMVHNYIFERFGYEHVALLGATVTFKDRAILRELGKVYGLPKGEIDELVANPHKVVDGDSILNQLLNIGKRIIDFPNIRSIHAGGVIISERPLTDYVALDMPPKGFPTIQWDMYVAEMIGFEKLDILSQRGIGHIQECAEIVQQNRGEIVDVHRVEEFKKDRKVNNRLHNGDAIGCFYIESPAMRGLLKKLKCNDYLRLVAASSIIRPGVAKSGMMKEYIKRFHDPKGFKYLHEIFKQQLGETYGVMVYQEDVIKICHHFAGLDLSDADILRRAMSGKYRSKKEFQRIQDTFFGNCKQRGYPDTLTDEVWRQISSFAGYAFSKAHSASYAVESYQSLYLKTYYPLEFMVAVINNFGGFYSTWLYVNEARVLGARIKLPCVNQGFYMTSICGKDIYLGFIHVKSLENKLAQQIITEREKNGEYADFIDFAERVKVGIEQFKILIRVGALRFTGKSKSVLLWEAHLYFNKNDVQAVSKQLFPQPHKKFELPKLSQTQLEDAYDEYELLGFPVSVSRIDLLETEYRGNTYAANLNNKVGQRVRMVGDLVTIKNVHTVSRQWMHFGCFLDMYGQFFDTVNFPSTIVKYPFTGYGVYLLEGRVVMEFGFPSIEIEKMARLPFKPDPRFTEARIFGKGKKMGRFASG
ncbi:MAG: DNA polymerase III subunit alpha [Salinivirgaceae bacterium]|jgi:DNA-directed DNA polymerase III PolC|nr:DNA polymerase III subunit alpha [Salinivirgaceae bacterium]